MKNLREMAGKIIRDIQKPLSPVEIWEIAEIRKEKFDKVLESEEIIKIFKK